MGNNRKRIQIIIFIAVLLIGGYTIGSSLFSKDPIPREGSTAPAFTLMGADGKNHSLSDYKDRVVLVNFWGSWCEPCYKEMPAIQSQYAKWQDKGLVVLGLNLDESPITVQNFGRQYGLTFPLLFDNELRMRDRYRVVSYPTSFFIGRDGKIEKIHVGEMTEAFIEQTLTAILNK
ncbi:redoxin domain-containing protein [Paenibacillus koleovorans]|uniref:redoxin domain-containing protein n=1 Tax=Paenibacillus koleovorans TaxID=121608 RepID=UPI000FDB5403|nr:redoxin domain-containing protein [Paenibacillus koleovorans]